MTGRTLLVTLIAALLSETPAPPLAYRFDEVKSKVMRLPAGDESKAVKVTAGDPAAGGDVVTTGFWARTVIAVPERAARFELGSSARARLQGDEPGVLLVLEKGRLKAIFDALTEGPPVERRVAAPGALLAVRGTRYGLDVGEDGVTLLAVFEGTVEVLPTATGMPPVKVRASEYCTFGPRTPPMPAPMRDRGMSEKSWGRREAGAGGPDGRGGPGGPGGDRGTPGGPTSGGPMPGDPGQRPPGQPPAGNPPSKRGGH